MERVVPRFRLPKRLSRLRLKLWPAALAVAATLLFLVSFPTGEVSLWQGFLLAIPFLVTTTGLGWQAGLLLMPFGLALVFFHSQLVGAPATPTDYLATLLTMVLAALAGHQIFSLWRAAERRARRSERRAQLLQQAAVELNQAASVDSLYRNAPRLLSDLLPFTHAEIFVPAGDHLRIHTSWRWKVNPDFAIPLKTVTGRAYTSGQPQYVPDTRIDPDFMVAPGAAPTLSELALPISIDGEVRAVLNLEHDSLDAFGESVQESLHAFVRMVEEVLYRLDTTAELERAKVEQKVLADLSQSLLLAEDVAEATLTALEVLLPALDIDCGAFLALDHGRLRSLATAGELAPKRKEELRRGLPYEGALKEAWESKRMLFLDDVTSPIWSGAEDARSVAVVPIVDATAQVQALLTVTRTKKPRPWTAAQRNTLLAAATPISASLERATMSRQLIAMLAVIKQLSSSEAPDVLYSRAAEATVDLVPGAEAASILVRQGDLFYYEASVGWDLEELRAEAGPYTYAEQIEWYAGDVAAFEEGIARVLKGDAIAAHSATAERSPEHVGHGRFTEMRSQVMVPIVGGDGIVAILNIDNFSTEDAFSTNAVRLAESFAQHIAVLVRQAEQMVELELSAVTDPLTGIGNREGFERAIRQELARARRYEHHLNLVMLDLNSFKEVNDRFGHAAGDIALKQVAEALKSSKRATDSVFRWGGDEFAIILPEVRPEAARTAMERLAQAVSAISVQDLELGASVGLASYPTDGLDVDSLLARADDRMYEWKGKQAGGPAQLRRPLRGR